MEDGDHKYPCGYLGHADQISSVDFSPDGVIVASASLDGTVQLFERSTLQCVLVFSAHESQVNCVRFSRDGKRCASGSGRPTALVWDASDGCVLVELREADGDEMGAIAWSHDDRRIATGNTNTGVRVWDSETAQQLHIFFRSPDAFMDVKTMIRTVMFSSDDRYLVLERQFAGIAVVDTTDGTVTSLDSSMSDVEFIAFLPNTHHVLQTHPSKGLAIFDMQTKTILREIRVENEITFGALSPDGVCFAYANSDFYERADSTNTTVFILDVTSGKELGVVATDLPLVTCLAFSPDGQWIVAGMQNDAVYVLPTPGIAKLEMQSPTQV